MLFWFKSRLLFVSIVLHKGFVYRVWLDYVNYYGLSELTRREFSLMHGVNSGCAMWDQEAQSVFFTW